MEMKKPLHMHFECQVDCCRILRSYPGDWQIHLVNETTGEADLVTTVPERPSYKARAMHFTQCCNFSTQCRAYSNDVWLSDLLSAPTIHSKGCAHCQSLYGGK